MLKPLFQAPNAEDAVGQGEAASKKGKKKEKKERKMIRTAAGDVWEDSSLLEWDDNDFRYCSFLVVIIECTDINFC